MLKYFRACAYLLRLLNFHIPYLQIKALFEYNYGTSLATKYMCIMHREIYLNARMLFWCHNFGDDVW